MQCRKIKQLGKIIVLVSDALGRILEIRSMYVGEIVQLGESIQPWNVYYTIYPGQTGKPTQTLEKIRSKIGTNTSAPILIGADVFLKRVEFTFPTSSSSYRKKLFSGQIN